MLWRLCSEPVDQTVTRRAQAREPNLHIAVIVIVGNVRVIVLIILVKKAGKAKQNKTKDKNPDMHDTKTTHLLHSYVNNGRPSLLPFTCTPEPTRPSDGATS